MINRTKFFSMLRTELGSFNLSQVDGINVLLDEAPDDIRLDAWADCLATAWWETARTMQPIYEKGSEAYFSKYEGSTSIGHALGNTVRGDGFRFRGRGYVQLTGRRNYKKAGEATGVDLIANPDRALEPILAARILYAGMLGGWFTGKALGDFLDGVDESDDEDLKEYIQSRRVVNGLDRATEIGKYAIIFEHALRGSWMSDTVVVEKTAVVPVPKPKKPVPIAPKGLIAFFIDLLVRLFGKKGA